MGEPSVLPAASFQTIVLTPSIAHIPLENQEIFLNLENQEVILTPGQVQQEFEKIQESPVETSSLENLPDEINNGPTKQNMRESTSDLNLEIQEEGMDLAGPVAQRNSGEEEESPSVYDQIIAMLQRP